MKKLLCAAALCAAVLTSGAAAVPGIDLREASSRSRAPGLTVRLYPMAYLDNIFCVLAGREQPICFNFLDCVPGRAKKPLIFKVTVPKGFKLNLEYRYMKLMSAKKNSDGSVESTYLVKVPHYTDRPNNWGSAFGQISTAIKPDGKKYPIKYSVRSADGHGGSYTSWLMSIPAEQSPVPKFFKTGFNFCGLWATSLAPEAAKKAAKLVNLAGVNIVTSDYRMKHHFHSELKKVGVERCWGWREFLGDGYLIGVARKPESVKFRNARNQWVARGICPEEAAQEGPYYRKHFLAELERMMYKEDYGEHYMSNWEPIPFSKQGCFCPRCKTAFLKYSKLPEAELNKVWPGNVLTKYKALWQRFRAERHAQIVKNIQRTFRELDRKYKRTNPTMFLPEIAVANLFKGNEKYLGDFYAEYDARFYEQDLPGLEPWGPYFMHDFLGSYRAIPGRHITMTYVAEETIRQLLERNGKGRRPKLYAFPQGLQCGSWVTTPHAIAFETIAFFVAGWEGSFVYNFPDGYDGRYWNALTRANRLIAGHELFVAKGKRMKNIQAVPVSPYPKGVGIDNYSTSGKYFKKELNNGSMFRAFGFEMGKSRCLALANAWEKGKVVVSVKLPGMAAGSYRLTLSSSSKVSTVYSNARQLAKGIQLEIPAWEWLFVKIEPSAKGGTVPPVKLSAAELKGLKELAARDTDLIRSVDRVPEYRFDDFPFITAGPVTVRPKRNAKPANSVLEVKAPGYRGELLMSRGGIFTHIQPSGLSLKRGSFFGGDGVWGEYTGATNQQAFAFDRWSSEGDEVTVVLKSNVEIFAGMVLEKRYLFSPHKVTVTVKITNPDKTPFMLNYRLRSYWRLNGKPQILCGKTIVPDGLSFWGRTDPRQVSRPFRNAKVFNAVGATVVRAAVPEKNEKIITVDFLRPDSGIYFWRSRNKQEFTAEKTYPTVRLMPGKSAGFKAVLSFEGKK